ncbi:MAG: hypothetical protein JWN95_3551 [Frankiales bacterium]|nr:hypothetical protein [Frankiales bacterium]
MPGSLGALDLTSLVGLSEDEARQAVTEAGGTLRCIYKEDAPVTADYRPDRVTAWVDDHRIRRVFGLG